MPVGQRAVGPPGADHRVADLVAVGPTIQSAHDVAGLLPSSPGSAYTSPSRTTIRGAATAWGRRHPGEDVTQQLQVDLWLGLAAHRAMCGDAAVDVLDDDRHQRVGGLLARRRVVG